MICSNIFLVSKDLNIKHFTKIVRYLFIYAWHTLYRSGFETECTLLPRDKHVSMKLLYIQVYTVIYSCCFHFVSKSFDCFSSLKGSIL